MIEMRLTDLLPFRTRTIDLSGEGQRAIHENQVAREESRSVLDEARQRMATVKHLIRADEIAPLPRIWDDSGGSK